MSIEKWKKEVFTIPNLLSLFRIVLIPVYVVLYFQAESSEQFILAGAVLALSCLTDMVDGRIARKYNMVSTLGILLDPVADKATQFTITLCLAIKYPVLYPVLTLFVVKESFQLIAGIIAYANGKMLPGALFIGKICTTILFISLIALVLFPDVSSMTVDLIALVDACFLAGSFIGYVCAYYGKNKKIQDLNA